MKKFFPKSEYARNSIISVVGVGVASVIPILLYPFLGRIFTPKDFDVLGLFVTSTAILAVVANFRYGYAVAITKSDDEAKNVLFGSIILSLAFTVFLYLILLLFDENLVAIFDLDPTLSKWFYLLPISIFCTSACFGLNGWLNRKKRFTAMAVNKSIRRGGEGLFQLIFGKIKVVGGLIYGTFIGDVINFLTHYFQFKKADGNFKGITSKSVKQNLKIYSDFPKYNLIPYLLDTLGLQLPFLIVSAYYAKEISGQFYQSCVILAIPLALISMAISQVLLQKLTEKRDRREKMTPILLRHIYFLTGLAILGIFVLYPFGEEIFMIFLGDQWGVAGKMASLMVFSYVMKFIVSPVSCIIFALEEVKMGSIWQFLHFGGICSLFFFTSLDIDTFIFYYVIIDVCSYSLYLALILFISKRYDRNL